MYATPHRMQTSTSYTAGAAIVKPLEVLAFHLGAEEYGIDIQKVRELRNYETVTQLVNAPDYIKGIVNLRGVIVPIIDMRVKFNLGAQTYNQFTVVVIVNIAGHIIGMVVDSVSDVITLQSDQIKPPPEIGATLDTEYMIGMGVVDNRMLILMDIDKLMSSAEVGMIDKLAA